MALSKAQIHELQGIFDERSKLHNVAMTIKCNTKDSSFFFAYKDGNGNKKYLNLPIKPQDILTIIDKQIDNIEKDIIEKTTMSEDIEIIIMNEAKLESSIADYKSRYPTTYTRLATIRERLKASFISRLEDKDEQNGQMDITDDYHIEVCSDWQDKIYVFEFLNKTNEYIQFEYKHIYKL